MKTNATIQQLNEALADVNKKFDGNIQFNDICQFNSKKVKFTLRVKDSHKPGARLGFQNHEGRQRHLISACWHVHGYFFEYLFTHFDNIIIYAGPKKMQSNSDNWQDWNIGSNFRPLYYSEACECNK